MNMTLRHVFIWHFTLLWSVTLKTDAPPNFVLLLFSLMCLNFCVLSSSIIPATPYRGKAELPKALECNKHIVQLKVQTLSSPIRSVRYVKDMTIMADVPAPTSIVGA